MSLGDTAHEMRGAGVEEHIVTQVEIAGARRGRHDADRLILRRWLRQSGSRAEARRRGKSSRPQPSRGRVDPRKEEPRKEDPRLPRADLPPALAPRPETAGARDPRLAAFAALDKLPIEEKLAIFR